MLYAWGSARSEVAESGFFAYFIDPAACLQPKMFPGAGTPRVLDARTGVCRRRAVWRCATAMALAAVSERGFGRYHAANYDELMDHAGLRVR